MMDNLLAKSDPFPKEIAMPASPAFRREHSRHRGAECGYPEAQIWLHRMALAIEAQAGPF